MNARSNFFLALLSSALGCVPVLAATNNSGATNFEYPPLQIGSAQWIENQAVNKARQEKYRLQLPIPDATGSNVPRLNSLNAPASKLDDSPAAPDFSAAPEKLLKILFFSGVAVLAGFLALRKFAPQFLAGLNERFNPWAATPLPELAFTEKVRTEEEAFAEFVKKFKAASPISAANVMPEKTERATKFYAQASGFLNRQRVLLQNVVREPDEFARQKILSDLLAGLGELRLLADFPEVLPVWQVACALEGLLKQLAERIREVTPSTLRTVVGGVGLLDDLCATALQPHLLTGRPLKFLVVDDDLLSRHALSIALNKAFSRPDAVADGETALARIQQQTYDVIFLDVQMPGMDGFELCTKIRETTLNYTTPVVFVTGHADFDARARSTLSGGNELMAKPFLTFEITVKALTLAMQERLKAHAQINNVRREKQPEPLPAATATARRTASPVDAARPLLPVPDETDVFTREFLIRAEKQVGPLREYCQKMLSSPDEGARQNLLAEGFLRINSLVSQAGCEIIHPAYQMSIALEGLFRKLLENSKHSSPSTLATITTAVEVLGDLFAPGLKADFASNPPIELLVVDDDLVARRAIVGALQTVFNRPENVEDGEAALARAADKAFDVIFLDVVMPGMDGFEVCEKIRQTVANRATPVVFVTSSSNSEAAVIRVGGNDILGKPFLNSEITVKALTFALRGRLQKLQLPPANP